jgi:VanZ family protein
VTRALSLWGPVGVWMVSLFVASAQSDVGIAGRIPDWVTHGTAYCILGLLVSRATSGGFRRPLVQGEALLIVVLCTLYGVSDEFHQSFVPGRDATFWDVVKDFGGSTLGVLLWKVANPGFRPRAWRT